MIKIIILFAAVTFASAGYAPSAVSYQSNVVNHHPLAYSRLAVAPQVAVSPLAYSAHAHHAAPIHSQYAAAPIVHSQYAAAPLAYSALPYAASPYTSAHYAAAPYAAAPYAAAPYSSPLAYSAGLASPYGAYRSAPLYRSAYNNIIY